MADQQGEVVIVGADGAEHVFPAGFDPKRAASIVRGGTASAPAPAAPDAGGTWEDHPVLGKIFHPTGVKPGQDATARNRQGNVIGFGKGNAGIAPEDLLMGGMAVRSIAGATKAGGMLAGVKQGLAEVSPVIKYEALRRSMTAAGMPDAAATPLAMLLSGYRHGGGAAKAAETAASDVSAPGFPRLTKTKAQAAPTPVPQPGESLEGFPRVTETEARAAPTPVPQPGESVEGYPRTTRTEAQAAPTPVPQPGESFPGYPRVTTTPAAVESPLDMLLNRAVRQAEARPAGPYSDPGFPRGSATEASVRPTGGAPVPEPAPGESVAGFPLGSRTETVVVRGPASDVPVGGPYSDPGFPRGSRTVVPATPLDELLNQPVRAVGRGVTPADAVTANLEQRVAPVVEAPPSQTATLKKTATGRTGAEAKGAGGRFAKKNAPVTEPTSDEGWITPGETLQSVDAPEPTGSRGFWTGLRRGDLWTQLQDDLLKYGGQ